MLAIILSMHGLAMVYMISQSVVNCQPDELQTIETIDPSQLQDVDDWDYEPRIWSPDADQQDQHLSDQHEGTPGFEGPTSGLHQEVEDHYEPSLVPQAKLYRGLGARRKSYFRDTSRPPSSNSAKQHKSSATGNDEISATARAQTVKQGDTCDQFRVDTRETIICDRKRCDKIDFEWPKHENQLTLIETTKYGMRFHRADFAFGLESTARTRQIDEYLMQTSSNADPNNQDTRDRVKFDIFDLFKPKPKPSLIPKPRPTTSSTTTTEAPATTVTTIAPTESTSQPETTTMATTAPPNTTQDSDSESNNGPQGDPIEGQDNNATRLVTTFRLDTGRRRQQMVGFGGALSDSTCRNIKSLSPTMAKSLMEDYFGARGLRYNIARMSIGSSDFSTRPYTNNDKSRPDNNNNEQQAANNGESASGEMFWWSEDAGDDVEMNNFRLVEEDYEFKLPIARQAIATSRQEIKFFSSLWSPPTWMKNNSHIVHGYLKGDVYGPYYKALAEYIIKWLEAYRRNGIEFWATTGLNEPVTGIKPFIFHNSLGITREDYVTFIKLYLGPMMRQRGFANVKLIGLDDNKGYAPNLVKMLLDDEEASKYVAGIGVHWYMNDEYENLNFLARHYPDKFLLSTEACNGYLPFQVHTLPGNWDRGVAYMLDIIKTVQKGAVGWVDWNMVLNLYGGPSWANNLLDAPVIVNAARDEYYKSPSFYAIGHFSRFLEANSTRLDHRLANARYDGPVDAVGFRTPSNYIVIVALNANSYPVPFRIIVDRKLVKIVKLREDSFNTIVFKWKMKD